MPVDIRADWLREWQAELAYASTRADRSGRRLPLECLWRSTGALFHAAWLRWDRWRIEMILQDLKHAIRALRARPGFTTVAVLTLAIGIGGTTAIFGAVNAVLLRPLPYPSPDQLMRVFKTSLKAPDRVGGTVSPPDFTDWRRDSAVFTELAAYDSDSITLTGQGAAEVVRIGDVTGGFFAVLGAPPLYGRPITTADDPMGSRDVVVLGHGIWVRRFGSNPQ
ncbi:MAG TPA: ABC transporter permease, partial [Vicinamibacterales bacterium]